MRQTRSIEIHPNGPEQDILETHESQPLAVRRTHRHPALVRPSHGPDT